MSPDASVAISRPGPDSEAVLTWCRDLIDRVSICAEQRDLLHLLTIGLEAKIWRLDRWPLGNFLIALPNDAYSAIRPQHEVPPALAGAYALINLALDVFDDLADGDWQDYWADRSPAVLNLAAATVLSALVPLALKAIASGPEQLAALRATLAESLLRMSAGQLQDLGQVDRDDLQLAQVEAAVAGKTGAQLALYLRLATIAAGAPGPVQDELGAFGQAFGMIVQFETDLSDALDPCGGRDLGQGHRTLPIAAHLRHLPAKARDGFLRLLTAARADPDARRQVVGELQSSRALLHVFLAIETHRAGARAALQRAIPGEKRRAPLARWLAREPNRSGGARTGPGARAGRAS